jgi:hypothetical protein
MQQSNADEMPTIRILYSPSYMNRRTSPEQDLTPLSSSSSFLRVSTCYRTVAYLHIEGKRLTPTVP